MTSYESNINKCLTHFKAEQPHVTSELNFGSAFQLLCATLLSAQCTDARVNMVTPALFAEYPTAHEMAKATEEDVLPYVRSISYPNAKTEHLIAMARQLVALHEGEVPDNREALEALPGVGRKTASVVLAVWFGQPAMPVDTHVFRVAHRLHLVPKTADNPLKVEQKLVRYIPQDILADAHHWLLLHGRYVCLARKPKCEICPFNSWCKSSTL